MINSSDVPQKFIIHKVAVGDDFDLGNLALLVDIMSKATHPQRRAYLHYLNSRYGGEYER